MKEDFLIKIETWHKPDLGTLENVSSTSQAPRGLQGSGQGAETLSLPKGLHRGLLFLGQEACSLCLDLSYQHGIALSLL